MVLPPVRTFRTKYLAADTECTAPSEALNENLCGDACLPSSRYARISPITMGTGRQNRSQMRGKTNAQKKKTLKKKTLPVEFAGDITKGQEPKVSCTYIHAYIRTCCSPACFSCAYQPKTGEQTTVKGKGKNKSERNETRLHACVEP